MNEATIMIVASEAESVVKQVRAEGGDLRAQLSAAYKKATANWLAPTPDEQFAGGTAAVYSAADENEKELIKKSSDQVKRASAAVSLALAEPWQELWSAFKARGGGK